MEPIFLPTDALAEVLSFLSLVEREGLALCSAQMAQVIVPRVNAARKRVSSHLLHRCSLPH